MINGQEPPKHKFKDSFITICRAHHLALKTERAYWFCVRKYIKWLGIKSAKGLENDPTGNFRRYLSAMANEHPDREDGNEGVSASTQNLAFHSLRFLYEKVVGIQLGDLSNIPRARGHQRIVDVPPDDVANKLVTATNGQTGLALRLIRGTAGRLNDILRLRVKDLDFRKRTILISNYNGSKTRIVSIPQHLIKELKFLTRGLAPDRRLFDMESQTVEVSLRKARQTLRIKRQYTVYSLRCAGARQIAAERGFLAAHEHLGLKDANLTKRVLGKRVLDNLARQVNNR